MDLNFILEVYFLPYEHIYLYADNYNQDYKLVIFLFFICIFILSLINLFKFKDPF